MMKAYAKSNSVLRKKKNHPILAPDGSTFTHIKKYQPLFTSTDSKAG